MRKIGGIAAFNRLRNKSLSFVNYTALSITPQTFSLVSLGCPKNLVDSEQIVFALKQGGLTFRTEIDGCETVVLNTCGFLRSARDEARDYIRALIDLKRQNRIKRISVRGCMTKHEGIEKLRSEFPDVDEWYSTANEQADNETLNTLPQRELLTVTHVAYLRIADGCNRRCTFCAIPNIRGNFRSVPLEPLLDEAKRLADAGVKELVVIAQETTFWGSDIYGKPRLTELLRKLAAADGIRWIRLMYSYPQYFDDDLIALFAEGGKLLPYIDIPLQHCNDEILQRMNRRVTKAETETLLETLRNRIPNLVLRTSLITGFPGETDAMFSELQQFVDRWQFERAGVFAFSPERGTAAAGFAGRVPPRVIERRYEALYKTCEKYSLSWARRQKGNVLDVQIDGNYIDDAGRQEPNLYVARTYADAPDIDPVVFVTFSSPPVLPLSNLMQCEIVEAEACDLIGVCG